MAIFEIHIVPGYCIGLGHRPPSVLLSMSEVTPNSLSLTVTLSLLQSATLRSSTCAATATAGTPMSTGTLEGVQQRDRGPIGLEAVVSTTRQVSTITDPHIVEEGKTADSQSVVRYNL